jgi:cytochrome b subunit of formate dehydrogenase
MKNRASTHVLILLLTVALTAIAHYSIHYGALIRGYETSYLTAGRNIFLLFLLAILPIFLARFGKFQGNWTLYTSAILLFSIGLTVQYRLFSDPEYVSRKDKAEARQAKIKTLQLHYIQENYSAEKKQMMGLPATPPSPVDLSQEKPRPAEGDLTDVFLSGRTLIPLFAIACFIGAFVLWDCFADASSVASRGDYFKSGKIFGKYDSLGAGENSFFNWFRGDFSGFI